MRGLRAHLSYANVMSSIAVFMVLGGSAYAAATLPKNSVGSKQLKSNAVTSSKIKNGSLLSKDFKPGQLVAGAPGAAGPVGAAGAKGDTGAKGDKGDKGNPGATSVVVRSEDTVTGPGNNGSHLTSCNAGERATGGGVELSSGNSNGQLYFEPGGVPSPSTTGSTPTGWFSSWYNSTSGTNTIRVFAICAAP